MKLCDVPASFSSWHLLSEQKTGCKCFVLQECRKSNPGQCLSVQMVQLVCVILLKPPDWYLYQIIQRRFIIKHCLPVCFIPWYTTIRGCINRWTCAWCVCFTMVLNQPKEFSLKTHRSSNYFLCAFWGGGLRAALADSPWGRLPIWQDVNSRRR